MPASRVSGNLMILVVGNKPASVTPDTPSGWNTVASGTYTGGQGSAGADSGDVRITAFSRVTDAAESSPMTVTATGASCVQASITQVSRSGGSAWGITATGGSDETTGTAISITGATNISLAANDLVLAAFATNSDLSASSTTTSLSVSASGATIGSATIARDTSTNLGNDMHLVTGYASVTGGTSSGAPAVTATMSASGASSETGPGIFLRLYEASSASLTDVDTDESIATAQTGIAYTGTGLTDADGMLVDDGVNTVAVTSLSATNSTSGTFTAPTLAAVIAANVKFGVVTFDIQDGGVSLGTLAGTLTAESGYTVHDVTDVSQAADPGCIYYGHSPSITANEDQIVFDNDGGNITIDSQGFLTFSGGATSTTFYVYDETDNTWGTEGTFSVGSSSGLGARIRYMLRSFTKRRRF